MYSMTPVKYIADADVVSVVTLWQWATHLGTN